MNQLTTTKSNVPSMHLAVRGLEEGISRDDLIIPRAKIVQGMSAEAKKVPVGNIINSLTGEVMPAEFIPIIKFSQVIKFNPRDTKDPNFDASRKPGDLLWSINDVKDPRWVEGEFGDDGTKPTAMKTLGFLCLFAGQPSPVSLTFANTSYKVGKKLLSLIVNFSISDKTDIFARKYRLGSKEENGEKGAYYTFTVEAAGKSSEEDFKACEVIFDQFRGKIKDIKVDQEPNWQE